MLYNACHDHATRGLQLAPDVAEGTIKETVKGTTEGNIKGTTQGTIKGAAVPLREPDQIT